MKGFLKLSILLVLWSCNSESIDPIDLGYEYYPVNASKKIYQVREINYNLLGPDTSVYQVREYFTDTITKDGESVFILKRETRSDDTGDWESNSLFSVRKTDNFVSITENNQPVVRLSFPVKLDREWNANAFNTSDEANYHYVPTVVDELLTTAVDSSMITVQIADVPSNLVYRDERFDTYARGIGLIEKNYIRVTFCSVGCDSVNQIESGSVLNQYLIGYEE